MAKHNETGAAGEARAATYLQKKGYRLLVQGWRWGRAEVDIIAVDTGKPYRPLVFVEVKTRTRATFGHPEEAVDAYKQQLLYDAACAYTQEVAYEGEVRFDIIAITLEPQVEIRHFEDAFFPAW